MAPKVSAVCRSTKHYKSMKEAIVWHNKSFHHTDSFSIGLNALFRATNRYFNLVTRPNRDTYVEQTNSLVVKGTVK